MAAPRLRDPWSQYPDLREQFEASKVLVSRARERAARAAERARAMRVLLDSRPGWTPLSRGPQANLWEAVARELARAARERDAAFGVLSHELRQSLSAAVAAERLLLATTEPSTAARARDVLDRQLQHLTKLVDDLFDFSRLSLGAIAIAREELDLRDVLTQALEGMEAICDAKDQRLAGAIPETALIVLGDRTRLLQVFSNLLQNASRYTPAGGRIAVSMSSDGDSARVDVADTGQGIELASQKAIFEPFVRGHIDEQGLGVGLPLALRIVELHGGSLTVRSEGPDTGSTFSVTLPLLSRDEAAH